MSQLEEAGGSRHQLRCVQRRTVASTQDRSPPVLADTRRHSSGSMSKASFSCCATRCTPRTQGRSEPCWCRKGSAAAAAAAAAAVAHHSWQALAVPALPTQPPPMCGSAPLLLHLPGTPSAPPLHNKPRPVPAGRPFHPQPRLRSPAALRCPYLFCSAPAQWPGPARKPGRSWRRSGPAQATQGAVAGEGC